MGHGGHRSTRGALRDAIHVLVLPPRGTRRQGELLVNRPFKRLAVEHRPIDWSDPCEVPSLEFSGKLVRLSSEFVAGSGLQTSSGRDSLVLFRRESVEELWGRDSTVLDQLRSFTGLWQKKSVASYAFAAGLIDTSKWNVLWMRYRSDRGAFYLVLFKNNKKSTAYIDLGSLRIEIKRILTLLESGGGKSILLIDGYMATYMNQDLDTILEYCKVWRSSSIGSDHGNQPRRGERRFVVVTRVGTAVEMMGLENFESLVANDPLLRLCTGETIYSATAPTITQWVKTESRQPVFEIMKIRIDSWSLEDYEAAVQDDSLFWSVSRALGFDLPSAQDAPMIAIDDQVAAIRKKHSIAGSNVRYMFALSRVGVVESIADTSKSMKDLEAGIAHSGRPIAFDIH